jgi:hypothetical protein
MGSIFMLRAQGVAFGGTEGVRSRFHVFRSRTCFQWNGWRWVSFSCFARPDSFSTVPRASGSIFMFCAPEIIFGGTEGIGSHFHDLRSRACFRLYRGRRVSFSYFALPDTFSAVPRLPSPVFMFCAPEVISHVIEGVGSRVLFFLPGLIFGVTEGVGSRFHVLRSGLVFGGTVAVGSRFHILRARTLFRWY